MESYPAGVFDNKQQWVTISCEVLQQGLGQATSVASIRNTKVIREAQRKYILDNNSHTTVSQNLGLQLVPPYGSKHCYAFVLGVSNAEEIP